MLLAAAIATALRAGAARCQVLHARAAAAQAALDTRLIQAAKAGDSEQVRQLLEKGADSNATDDLGQPAISCASLTPVVSTIHGTQLKGTCITIIQRRGYPETAKLLLLAGARVRVKDAQGWTPLSRAFETPHLEFQRLLKEAEEREPAGAR
jgi:ankyrin repeat protein